MTVYSALHPVIQVREFRSEGPSERFESISALLISNLYFELDEIATYWSGFYYCKSSIRCRLNSYVIIMSGPCQEILIAKALCEKELVAKPLGALFLLPGRTCRRRVVGCCPATLWGLSILLIVENAYIVKKDSKD
jgi:hypothetical protein